MTLPNSIFVFVAALFSIAQHVVAAPSNSTTNACKAIDAALPDRLSWPLEIAYINETQEYWSTALRDLQPACVVHPTSADEVSTIVKILNGYPDVNFAVKSGGHDVNPGHGSIQDGVLIAMREITGATYDAATGLASVKPGGTWNSVIGELAPNNVTVVGGRLGIVGVGGYLLQGGISLLSAQYGLACDSIVGWETIMPNGSIVNVDAASRPDLAVAMRGSGSQFGIVTKFTIQAHPIAQVWGGLRIYADAQRSELYAALHDFIPNGPKDPKAAVIFTDVAAVGSLPVIIVYYFYDGTTHPTTGPFANFLNITYLIDQTSTRTYPDLLQSNGAPAGLLMSRVSFRTFTLPYIPSNPDLYQQIHNKWISIVSTYLDNPLHATAQCSIDFQPLPSIIGSNSASRGGNAMGLSASDPDRLLLELQCSWASALDDATVYNLTRTVTAWMQSMLPTWEAQAGLTGEYLPYFMNDAMGDQNVTGSYSQYAQFKALQAQVDPKGYFKARAGGFKY